MEHMHLIFHDKDSPDVNQYEARVLEDSLGLFTVNCNKYENDLERPPQTAIHCSKSPIPPNQIAGNELISELKFRKNMQITQWTYSVVLELKDITLIDGNKAVSRVETRV